MLKKHLVLSMFFLLLTVKAASNSEAVQIDAQYKSQLGDYIVVRSTLDEGELGRLLSLFTPHCVYAENKAKNNSIIFREHKPQSVFDSAVCGVTIGTSLAFFIGKWKDRNKQDYEGVGAGGAMYYVYGMPVGMVVGAIVGVVTHKFMNQSKYRQTCITVFDYKDDETISCYQYGLTGDQSNNVQAFVKNWIDKYKYNKRSVFNDLVKHGCIINQEMIETPMNEAHAKRLKSVQTVVGNLRHL